MEIYINHKFGSNKLLVSFPGVGIVEAIKSENHQDHDCIKLNYGQMVKLLKALVGNMEIEHIKELYKNDKDADV